MDGLATPKKRSTPVLLPRLCHSRSNSSGRMAGLAVLADLMPNRDEATDLASDLAPVGILLATPSLEDNDL